MRFSFFQNFDLLGWVKGQKMGGGGKRAKNGSKGQKNLSVSLYLRNHTSCDCGFW